MRCQHCHDRDCPGCCDDCPRCDGGKRGRRREEPDDFEREPTAAELNIDAGVHLDRVARAKGLD